MRHGAQQEQIQQQQQWVAAQQQGSKSIKARVLLLRQLSGIQQSFVRHPSDTSLLQVRRVNMGSNSRAGLLLIR
jgi:hypothetical protein